MNPFNMIKYWPIKDCEWDLLSRDVWIAKAQNLCSVVIHLDINQELYLGLM